MLASQYQSNDWNQQTTNQSSICWRNFSHAWYQEPKGSEASKPNSALFCQLCSCRIWELYNQERRDISRCRMLSTRRQISRHPSKRLDAFRSGVPKYGYYSDLNYGVGQMKLRWELVTERWDFLMPNKSTQQLYYSRPGILWQCWCIISPIIVFGSTGRDTFLLRFITCQFK